MRAFLDAARIEEFPRHEGAVGRPVTGRGGIARMSRRDVGRTPTEMGTSE
ncbi:hypothetical protein SGM_2255 [Streptomyces griseoaurantiacus M045]|uniref:Uncharacterized protein n=1 Tax=Streptomyces griseoaurantiacus M045 TaxID=996637 RepID=F3NGJ1_9ACTN|nr:hypothetical protein SGM_2255 [Streptomyces griseoaurantiacus M045]